MILQPPHFFAGLSYRHYRCILLDPPWKFSAGTNGRPQHYARMTDEEIAAMPLKDLAHPDGCWVFCWVTSPKMRHLFRVNDGWQKRKDVWVPGWGAKYSARAFVWIKTNDPSMFFYEADLHTGMGFTTRKNAEDCMLFKFGTPKRTSKSVREPIIAPVREHSRKPDETFDRIEQYCDGPRVEIFSRESRSGWDAFGNQTGLFDAPKLELAA